MYGLYEEGAAAHFYRALPIVGSTAYYTFVSFQQNTNCLFAINQFSVDKYIFHIICSEYSCYCCSRTSLICYVASYCEKVKSTCNIVNLKFT